jgi:S1-C subfamily serine protease
MLSKWKPLGWLLSLSLALLVLVPTASPQDVESVAVAAKSSVAVILAEEEDGIVSGTGFMAAGRLILTAEHVVANSRRIVVKFPNYPVVDAELLGADSDNDVAVLSIPELPVRPLPLGDISQVREGQRVIVVGFPRVDVLGAETATVTEGIVSTIRPGLIQMQAPVSPGSSGGPVLNLNGEVIGIVLGTLSGEQQGLNFAVAINAAKPLLDAALVGPVPPLPLSGHPAIPPDLTIRITSLTSPVSPGAVARLEIQTTPGAQCNITVVYKSGPSRASGLVPKVADASGRVIWIWRVGTRTTPGTWPILVGCVFGPQDVEAQTEFTVR